MMQTLDRIIENFDMRRALIWAIPAGSIAGIVNVFLIDQFHIDVWAGLFIVSLLATILTLAAVYFLFRGKQEA